MDKNIIEVGDHKIVTDFLLIGDMENIYLKKNEIDHARKNGEDDRANKLYFDFINMLYPDVPSIYQEYVLLYNLMIGEGRSNYNLQYKCPHCEKINASKLSVGTNQNYPSYTISNGIKIEFNFIEDREIDLEDFDIYYMVRGIYIENNFITWDRLHEESQEILISYIDNDDYPKILHDMHLCRATFYGHGSKCCDEGIFVPKEDFIRGGFNIFDILVNSNNLTTLYKINHQLLSRGISLQDQKMMKPFERNIYISMIVKNEKEEESKNENRFSKY